MQTRYLLLAVLLVGCSSPKQKYDKCQQKCAVVKTDIARRICDNVCERQAYGELDADKLASLCDDNDPIACLRYALKTTDADKIATKLQACCDRKTAQCCGVLGKMYSRGKILKTDRPKGYGLMEQACSLGDGTSCASPGLEQLTKRNYERARQLFALGCEKDSKHACGLLGVIYRDGKGVPRNTAEAKKYLDKACKLGAEASCKALRRL